MCGAKKGNLYHYVGVSEEGARGGARLGRSGTALDGDVASSACASELGMGTSMMLDDNLGLIGADGSVSSDTGSVGARRVGRGGIRVDGAVSVPTGDLV